MKLEIHAILTVDWPSWALDLNNLPVSDEELGKFFYATPRNAPVGRMLRGCSGRLIFIVWNSERTSTQSARIRRRENCVQGSGAALRAELDPTELILGDARLRFRSYRFERYGLPLFVYYLVWEEGNRDVDEVGVSQDWSGSSRLERVWLGQRNIGQQSVEIILAGTNDEREARTALQDETW